MVGTLGLCSYMDYEKCMEELQPHELGSLLENHFELEKQQYELFAYSFQVGYARVKTGKKIEMFKNEEKQVKVKPTTPEKKKEELDFLKSTFNKGAE